MADMYGASGGGNVIISEEVIISIAARAAAEVDGFAGFTAAAGETKLFKNGKDKGIRLSAEEGATDIDLFIKVRHGYRLPDVAENIQNAVSQAMDELTSFCARSINVHITDIDFRNPKETNAQ